MKSAQGAAAMKDRGMSVWWLAFVAACGATQVVPGIESDEQPVQSGPVVVINEFTPGSSGRIELYNAGDATADLTGWQVDDIAGGGTAPKSVGTGVVLAPGAYLVVSYSGINYASADDVRLVDGTGAQRDAHSNFYTGTSTNGLCFGRQPDGGAWATAAIPCSLGATNGGNPPPPPPVDAGIDARPDAAPDAPPDSAPDAAPDAPPPPPSGIELVSLPRRDHVLLQGLVVAPSGPFTGEVLVEGDTITCVATSCAAMPAASDAAVVRTNGIILPGLIDTHNHILFDIFDETDWSPTKAYTNHNQWTAEARYKALVDAKQYLNGEGSSVSLGCEMDKYGELKALIAGTTAVQGSANPADKACYASLARTIDQSPNGLASDKVQTAAIFPATSTADGVCNNYATGKTDAYVIHIAEGVDTTARNEFAKLGTVTTTPQCLYAPKTTIVHGAALGDAEFTTMAQQHMTLVWSPRSNVFLYGSGTDLTKTANIPLALAKGITIAIAPDWSIGGSQNMLDELRFADQVDNTVWGNQLSSHQLFDMATINAAHALGLGSTLGSIEVGKKADLFVIGGDTSAPYDALLASHPRDVRLVMVGGVALYGDSAVAALGPPNPGCETLDICGGAKFACVAQTGGTATNKLGQTFAEISSTLSTGLQAYDDLNLTAYDFSPITPLVKCN
jgi:cytosine/adenosine deaminase-related metal-dependent hydrolase